MIEDIKNIIKIKKTSKCKKILRLHRYCRRRIFDVVAWPWCFHQAWSVMQDHHSSPRENRRYPSCWKLHSRVIDKSRTSTYTTQIPTWKNPITIIQWREVTLKSKKKRVTGYVYFSFSLDVLSDHTKSIQKYEVGLGIEHWIVGERNREGVKVKYSKEQTDALIFSNLKATQTLKVSSVKPWMRKSESNCLTKYHRWKLKSFVPPRCCLSGKSVMICLYWFLVSLRNCCDCQVLCWEYSFSKQIMWVDFLWIEFSPWVCTKMGISIIFSIV